jgi:hypothetical protein
MIRFLAISAAVLISGAGGTDSSQFTPKPGDEHEIVLMRDSAQSKGDQSSGSSHDQDTILERVVGLRADGLELEFDLPKAATAQERARSWQLPARVFKPIRGPMQLLNAPELEARVDGWLKAGKMTRLACGRWIFTWNAFRIECDPQSVIPMLEAFNLEPSELREGADYRHPKTLGTARLARKRSSDLFAELRLDPDAVRRERAEGDVVAGEILGKPVAIEQAMRERSAENISGTMTVTFELDAAGHAQRRTKVTTLKIKTPHQEPETETVTETLERRNVSVHE